MELTQTRPITLSFSKKAAFIALEIIFFSVIYFISGKEIPTNYFILFALAALRMARTISFNEVAGWIREPFTEVKPDSCGAGSDVHPKGEGVKYVIGALIACPICSGTWSALALYATWVIYEPLGKTLIWVMAIAGGSEILHYIACAFEWDGRAARVYSGMIAPDRE